MKSKTLDGIQLYFGTESEPVVGLFEDTCRRAAPIIRDLWGLKNPPACRVYIMTSWMDFLFHSVGWAGKIAFALTLPLLYLRMKRQWPLIAGWTFQFRNRPTIGVKPPALLAQSDTRIGSQIYLKEQDLEKKVKFALCHELTHAFAAALRLPLWLNEGLAMVTVDHFAQSPTIRPETISLLGRTVVNIRPATYRTLMRGNAESIVYNYARSYWIVRFLEDCHPGLIKRLLVKRRSAREIERQVSLALGFPPNQLWMRIDELVTKHFSGSS